MNGAACGDDDPPAGDVSGDEGGSGGAAAASTSSSGGSPQAGPGTTCGDGACDAAEACDTCEPDCGKCAGWCAQDAACSPFVPDSCPDDYPVCQPAVDYFNGDRPELELGCWKLHYLEVVNQPVGEPCGSTGFTSDATCAIGLLCIDPTPFQEIEAGDPPSVYDARCHKACCDDADCGPSGQCKKLYLPTSGSLGYCP